MRRKRGRAAGGAGTAGTSTLPCRASTHRHGLGWPHAQLSHNLSVLPQLQRQSPLLQVQTEQRGSGRSAAVAAAAAASTAGSERLGRLQLSLLVDPTTVQLWQPG